MCSHPFFWYIFFGNLLNPDDGDKRETCKSPNISCYQGINEISRVERIARTTMQSEIILTKLYGHFFFFCIIKRNTMWALHHSSSKIESNEKIFFYSISSYVPFTLVDPVEFSSGKILKMPKSISDQKVFFTPPFFYRDS